MKFFNINKTEPTVAHDLKNNNEQIIANPSDEVLSDQLSAEYILNQNAMSPICCFPETVYLDSSTPEFSQQIDFGLVASVEQLTLQMKKVIARIDISQK